MHGCPAVVHSDTNPGSRRCGPPPQRVWWPNGQHSQGDERLRPRLVAWRTPGIGAMATCAPPVCGEECAMRLVPTGRFRSTKFVRTEALAAACAVMLSLPLLLPAGTQAAVTGSMTDLGTLGGTDSSASAINARGQITGQATTAAGQYHAFRWTPSRGMQDLGTPPCGYYKSASAINALGQITGGSRTTAAGELRILAPPARRSRARVPVDRVRGHAGPRHAPGRDVQQRGRDQRAGRRARMTGRRRRRAPVAFRWRVPRSGSASILVGRITRWCAPARARPPRPAARGLRRRGPQAAG
jgi:probable HAF family extracellular repeat protein